MIDPTSVQESLKLCIENKQDQPVKHWRNRTLIDMAKMAVETVERLNREIIEHRHELVIDGHKVVRLQDVYNGEDDYYWIYNDWVGLKGMYEENTGEHHASCVGHHILLKESLSENDYNEMVRVWNLNNFVKAI